MPGERPTIAALATWAVRAVFGLVILVAALTILVISFDIFIEDRRDTIDLSNVVFATSLAISGVTFGLARAVDQAGGAGENEAAARALRRGQLPRVAALPDGNDAHLVRDLGTAVEPAAALVSGHSRVIIDGPGRSPPPSFPYFLSVTPWPRPPPMSFPAKEPTTMPDLHELIRDYTELLAEEHRLAKRKEGLRAAILAEMGRRNIKESRTEFGNALRTSRLKLLPRRVPVLGLLDSEDLFPFANFTAARVKELLVPKYGREALIPLFEIQKSELLVVKRPPGIY
jgi:hypothetical protein